MPLPSPPTNVTAKAAIGQITVSWSYTGSGSFDLYRGTSSGSETRYQTGITTTSYDDSAVISGTTYYYQAVTVLNGLNSLKSNEAHATAL